MIMYSTTSLLNKLNKLSKYQLLRFSFTPIQNKIRNDENSSAVNIFDRYTKSLQRERAAAASDVNLYDYLKDEMGYRLADRIFDIKRKFKLAANIGII